MINIFSKIDKSKILLTLLKFENIKEKRTDMSPNEEYMQASGRILNKDFSVKAHKHNFLKRETTLTQEAWVILRGKIKAHLR